MLRRASPSGFLPKIETSSDRSREFPDTSCSSVADGSRQTGGPFLLHNCAGVRRSAGKKNAFLPPVLFLMQVAPETDHLRVQKHQCCLDKQEVQAWPYPSSLGVSEAESPD